MATDTLDKLTRRTGVLYDPRNDWHFDVIKAFHQSLIDDRYPRRTTGTSSSTRSPA